MKWVNIVDKTIGCRTIRNQQPGEKSTFHFPQSIKLLFPKLYLLFFKQLSFSYRIYQLLTWMLTASVTAKAQTKGLCEAFKLVCFKQTKPKKEWKKEGKIFTPSPLVFLKKFCQHVNCIFFLFLSFLSFLLVLGFKSEPEVWLLEITYFPLCYSLHLKFCEHETCSVCGLFTIVCDSVPDLKLFDDHKDLDLNINAEPRPLG